MKFTEVFSYFFLEDTQDAKSFSLARLIVFMGACTAVISSIGTIYIGININNILPDATNLSLMIGFSTALWTAVFAGKYFSRKSENETPIEKNITNDIN